MKKPEILAPAGNKESFIAAIEAGADAVYIGGNMFGARSFANNFNKDELKDAVVYAHKYGVKVYITTNTLIYENEVERFTKYISFLNDIGVDAVIMQDIGMMDKIRQEFPELEIHASTQMHIHNLEGVKFLEQMGLTRAVLARETDYETIKNIKKNTNIELEIFVHGALCISYSGQCLISSLIGNRSGNRGTCAGSCRQTYDVLDKDLKKVNKEKYNLSTKDLNSLENLDKLIEAGADSLKIEGRMKSPSYVYLVVSLYRMAVDSYFEKGKIYIDKNKLNDLKVTFNRKFTKGFLFNADNKDIINPERQNHIGVEIGKVVSYKKGYVDIMLNGELSINDGIRITDIKDIGFIVTSMFKKGSRIKEAKNSIITLPVNEPVNINSKVFKTLDYKINKDIEKLSTDKKRKVEINGKIIIEPNDYVKLTVDDGINIITVKSNIVAEKAQSLSTSVNRVIEQLRKTGASVYEFKDIQCENKNEFFISIKEINEMRRAALEQLDNKRTSFKKRKKGEYSRNITKDYAHKQEVNYYIQNIDDYKKIKNKKYQFLYLDSELYNMIEEKNKIRKINRVIEQFDKYEDLLLVGELGSVYHYGKIHTDFSLNVVNSYSVALLHSLGADQITLSLELEINQIEDIINNYKRRYNKNPNLELIVSGREEVMISKFNLLEYYNLKEKGYLLDRFNNKYPIKIKDNLMVIYNFNKRDLKNIQQYYNIGINNIRYNMD